MFGRLPENPDCEHRLLVHGCAKTLYALTPKIGLKFRKTLMDQGFSSLDVVAKYVQNQRGDGAPPRPEGRGSRAEEQ